MGSDHLSRLDDLVVIKALDRSEVTRSLARLDRVIVDLRAKLDGARRRLAAAEADVLAAESQASMAGRLVLDARRAVAQEHQEAEVAATATIAAADATAAELIGAARAEAAELRTLVAELRLRSQPGALVLDFTARLDDSDAHLWAPDDDGERIAAG